MVDGDLPSPKLTAKPPENGWLVQMIRFLSGRDALFSRALADSFSLSVILDENQVTKKSHNYDSRWWQLKYFLCSPRKLGK